MHCSLLFLTLLLSISSVLALPAVSRSRRPRPARDSGVWQKIKQGSSIIETKESDIPTNTGKVKFLVLNSKYLFTSKQITVAPLRNDNGDGRYPLEGRTIDPKSEYAGQYLDLLERKDVWAPLFMPLSINPLLSPEDLQYFEQIDTGPMPANTNMDREGTPTQDNLHGTYSLDSPPRSPRLPSTS